MSIFELSVSTYIIHPVYITHQNSQPHLHKKDRSPSAWDKDIEVYSSRTQEYIGAGVVVW